MISGRASCAVLALMVAASTAASQTAPASPAEGYNVHVLAPHLVDGKTMGPYHHYCKDPAECLARELEQELARPHRGDCEWTGAGAGPAA